MRARKKKKKKNERKGGVVRPVFLSTDSLGKLVPRSFFYRCLLNRQAEFRAVTLSIRVAPLLL